MYNSNVFFRVWIEKMEEVTRQMLREFLKTFSQTVENIASDIKKVRTTVRLIGEQNYQLKKVLTELASEHKRNQDDFEEAMGIVRETSWF